MKYYLCEVLSLSEYDVCFCIYINWLVLSVYRVYNLTLNLENLYPPGALRISKIQKNFFSKTSFFNLCDTRTPPNDLGLITPKCIF